MSKLCCNFEFLRRFLLLPESLGTILLLILLHHQSFSQQLHTERYKNNAVKSEGVLKDGSKEGEWKYYYPSGKMMSRENFREGVLQGKIEYYFPDGKLQAVEQWQNGMLQDSAFYFYNEGSLERKGIYYDHQYAGTWKYF